MQEPVLVQRRTEHALLITERQIPPGSDTVSASQQHGTSFTLITVITEIARLRIPPSRLHVRNKSVDAIMFLQFSWGIAFCACAVFKF